VITMLPLHRRINQMKSCIVEAHVAGLGSIINNLVIWLHEANAYPRWTGSLYTEPGEDLWPELFLPIEIPKDVTEIVCVHPSQWLTWRNAAELYQGKSRPTWRTDCNKLWLDNFIPVPPCTDFVQRFVDELMPTEKKIVAAQIRWHGHSGEQIYPHKSQTLEQYAAAIGQEKPDLVYVASGDQHSLDWLAARFPVICHPTSRRSPTRDTDFHRTEKQTPADARHVLEEIMLMALCDVLVHPVSNLATVALYCNPTLKSVYLP